MRQLFKRPNFILALLFLLASSYSFAGDEAAVQYFKKGEEYFNDSSYDKALNMYKKAIEERSYDGMITIRKEKVKMVPYGRVLKKEVTYDDFSDDYYPNRRIAEIEKTLEELAAPCDLFVTSRFQDGNTVQANNSLDPEENGVLLVTVKNSGKGAAFKTNLQISSDNSRIEYDKWVELGDIKPGETIETRINLRAATNVGDGRAKFTLAFKEKRGKYDVSETAYVPTAKQELPQLGIIVDKELDDSDGLSPNGMLDGGENAYMNLTIKNLGKGRADKTRLEIASDNRSIEFDKNVDIGDFKPGEEKQVRILLHAGYYIDNGKAKLSLSLKEDRGFDSKTKPVLIQTVKWRRPEIKIVSVDINDGTTGLSNGNGNGKLENGEDIELTVLIENQGVGKAVKVNLFAEKITSGIQWKKDSVAIGDILPGRREKAKLAFRIPADFRGKEVLYSLKATDSRGIKNTDTTSDKRLAVNILTPDIQYRILSKGLPVVGISNGMSFEAEITMSNKGQLVARDVVFSLSSIDGVTLSPSTISADEIQPNSTTPSQRIRLSTTRTFDKKEIPLKVSVMQATFPPVIKTESIAVNLIKPNLKLEPTIVNASGGNTIEELDSNGATLELFVKNNGGMAAEDVKVMVSSLDEKLIIWGNTEVTIDKIPANSSSEVLTFSLYAKKGVVQNYLAINVIQKDFESESLPKFAVNTIEEGVQVAELSGQDRGTAAKRQAGPIIELSAVDGRTASDVETYNLRFNIPDSKNIARIAIFLNDKPFLADKLAIEVRKWAKSGTIPIKEDIPLDEGENKIRVLAETRDLARSEKIFTITRDVEADVDYPVPSNEDKPKAIGVVIGISKNKNLGSVDYARRDAEIMKLYLNKTLGFKDKNIEEFYDENATATDLKSYFKKLKGRVTDKTDVFVFYSGHGAPDTNTNDTYLVAYDYDPADPETTGFAVKDLYKRIDELGARSATIVLDSCFSGTYNDGTSLIKSASAGLLKPKDPIFNIRNGVRFTAATNNQIASWYKKRQHGLFTYYFLQGLRGSADDNNDGQITVGELEKYLKINVSEQARAQYSTREQTPEVEGNRDAVLVKYK